jgi:hypothetical protein
MAETNTKSERATKGLTFGSETFIRKPEPDKNADVDVFAVCLKTDDESLLFPKKVYKVKIRGNRVRVIDEEGEVAIYPKDFFLVLSLSPSAESTLAGVLG